MPIVARTLCIGENLHEGTESERNWLKGYKCAEMCCPEVKISIASLQTAEGLQHVFCGQTPFH